MAAAVRRSGQLETLSINELSGYVADARFSVQHCAAGGASRAPFPRVVEININKIK
jgi:hypothetical protein